MGTKMEMGDFGKWMWHVTIYGYGGNKKALAPFVINNVPDGHTWRRVEQRRNAIAIAKTMMRDRECAVKEPGMFVLRTRRRDSWYRNKKIKE